MIVSDFLCHLFLITLILLLDYFSIFFTLKYNTGNMPTNNCLKEITHCAFFIIYRYILIISFPLILSSFALQKTMIHRFNNIQMFCACNICHDASTIYSVKIINILCDYNFFAHCINRQRNKFIFSYFPYRISDFLNHRCQQKQYNHR